MQTGNIGIGCLRYVFSSSGCSGRVLLSGRRGAGRTMRSEWREGDERESGRRSKHADALIAQQPGRFFPSRYWSRQIREHERAQREGGGS